MIRISPTIKAGSREQLARHIYDTTFRRVFPAAGVLAQLCERNVKAVIEENFVTDRPTNRRRYPGGPRLINSFHAVVEGPKDRFPIKVSIQPVPRVANDPDQMAKILSLLYGSRPHEIAPTKGFLRFPYIGYRGRTAKGSAKRQFEAFGRPNTRLNRAVQHPGTRATNVLEEAARRSMKELRRRGV